MLAPKLLAGILKVKERGIVGTVPVTSYSFKYIK